MKNFILIVCLCVLPILLAIQPDQLFHESEGQGSPGLRTIGGSLSKGWPDTDINDPDLIASSMRCDVTFPQILHKFAFPITGHLAPFQTRFAMRLSRFYLPTLKDTPAEAQIASHRLMLRAGMVRQSSAGIYSWLPLGLRVLKNIENIVREEQNAIGCHEVLMPTIQPADLWRKSGRYDDYSPERTRIIERHHARHARRSHQRRADHRNFC